MMNKKIAMSAFSIVTALALTAGATYAFFTDTATSNGNTFSAGTFDLHVSDDDQDFGDAVTASMTTPTGWAPGDVSGGHICFKNNGSVDIQQILFDLNSTNAGDPNNDLDEWVYVDTIELGNVTGIPGACDDTGVFGNESLTDFTPLFETRFGDNETLENLLTEIDGTNMSDDDLLDGGVNLIPTGGIMKLRVFWRFDEDAPTTNVAGKTVNLDILFNATQNEEL